MSEQRKVPKLRFPEFTDDWEQREFAELVTIERGGHLDRLTNSLQTM